jgi:hypothetical protein
MAAVAGARHLAFDWAERSREEEEIDEAKGRRRWLSPRGYLPIYSLNIRSFKRGVRVHRHFN